MHYIPPILVETENADVTKEANLHRFAIAGVLGEKYRDMQNEFMQNAGYGRLKMNYSAMYTLHTMVMTQSRIDKEMLAEYLKKSHELDLKYGSSVDNRSWQMTGNEALERKILLENLLYDLGPSRIDERPEAPEYRVYDEFYNVDGRKLVYEIFKKRFEENRNLVILFTGQVGGGKSWASISIADYLTPSLKVGYDLQGLVFDVSEFIDHVLRGTPGEVIILDEAGISAGSRDALTTTSKTLSKVVQSIRYLKYCTIFTLPNVNFLDKQIRLMVDLIFYHEENTKQGSFKVMVPKLSDDGKEVTYADLIHNGKLIRTVFFPVPRPALIEDYEKIRREHNFDQLKELQKGVEKKEDTRGKNINSLKNLRHFKGDGESEQE